MTAQDRTGRADPEPAEQEHVRSSQGLRQATGRDRPDWFATLDAWGAAGRPYREIADWLEGEHGLTAWWAQKLIVEYEQARGLRAPGARPDGTFAGGASKTVAVPVAQVFGAFIDPVMRDRWLPGLTLQERTVRPGRSARFDWEDGASRVNVSFSASGERKTQVAVEHERLPDPAAAERAKAYWRDRLVVLKTLLES